MACVFTLITALVFVTQHMFASIVLAGAFAAAVGATARRAQRGPTYQSTAPWPAPEMSSAALLPRRLPSLPPGGARHE